MVTLKGVSEYKNILLTTVFFIAISGWWLVNSFSEPNVQNDIIALLYPLVSLWGGVWGLLIARQWGGTKSILGRAFAAFSIGLLGQSFGQLTYMIDMYVLNVNPPPYPSVADIGFFSTGIFYAYGAVELARAAGVKLSLKSYKGQAMAIVIPILWAVFSYIFFLRGYEFDWQQPITIILDLISPVIDGAYLSLAILVYLLSRKFLGGMMKWPVLILLIAIAAEAVSDYTYIYLSTYNEAALYQGSFNDFMYFATYTFMALALMYLGVSFNKLTEDHGN